jgi:hypothetical protein
LLDDGSSHTLNNTLGGDLLGDGNAGRRVEEVALDQVLLDFTPRSHDHSRQQADDLVPRDVDLWCAGRCIRDRDTQRSFAGAGRLLRTQPSMERAIAARPDRGYELVDEGTADDRDLRVRLALERVEREGDAQLGAIAKPPSLGVRQP